MPECSPRWPRSGTEIHHERILVRLVAACLNGYVYLGYTALDEETGEEVERVEALPCRRCADSR
jgi:hypothetical protein